jgi:hypothetical protein
MVRRSTNLFELLRTRGSEPPAERGGAPALPLGERIRGWFGRAPANERRPRGRSPNRIRVDPQILRYSLSAPALAALAVAMLGVGFGAGWWAGGKRGGAALQTGERSPAGQIGAVEPGGGPAPLTEAPSPAPSTLGWPPEKQYEQVSKWAWPLLHYAPSHEQAAIRLAAWLRDQGLQDARVLRFDARGESRILALLYVVEGKSEAAKAARAQVLERLQQLPAPPFEPRFPQALRSLDPTRFVQLPLSQQN